MSLELKPSIELLELIQEAAQTLVSFAEKWKNILVKGEAEGFREKELQEMARPFLKQQLSKDQIYYLFNSEQKKEYTNTHRNVPTNDDKNDTEQIPRPKAYRLEEESQTPTELEGVTNDPQTAVDVVEENKTLRTLVQEQREVIAKLSVTTATETETNMDRLFEMLPSDDVDTFKNKSGNLLLFERMLVNFKYQKIPKLQWWVRVIK